MPTKKDVAQAKRRLRDAEKAVSRLGNEANPDDAVLRVRLIKELRRSIEHHYAVMSEFYGKEKLAPKPN